MKLYVWHDVLKDYSYGIAFAYASSLEGAVKQLEKKFKSDGNYSHHYWGHRDDRKKNLKMGRFCGVLPTVHEDDHADFLIGGA